MLDPFGQVWPGPTRPPAADVGRGRWAAGPDGVMVSDTGAFRLIVQPGAPGGCVRFLVLRHPGGGRDRRPTLLASGHGDDAEAAMRAAERAAARIVGDAGRPIHAARNGWERAAVDVLLVEDDELVRECLGEILAEAGWRVGTAEDAGQALALADAGGAPGVLVADLCLGRGMDGLALVAAVRHRRPGMGAVLMTGAAVGRPALGPLDRFLRKPFGADALVRLVEGLGARPTATDRTPRHRGHPVAA